jgi:uncharacterized protein (TIGR02646 family)
MRKIVRSPAPEILRKNSEKWGLEYKAIKEKNQTHSFSWKQSEGVRVNKQILPQLQGMSEGHCHYCDGYPPGISDDTSDHFKPKGYPAYFHLVYEWNNLFLACADCQRHKMELFDEKLLRPDDADFDFSRYFFYNYRNHEIEIRSNLSAVESERAGVTISIFGFNDANRQITRRHAWERWIGNQKKDVSDFPFRFMYD